MADGSGLEMVAYISMAFGNPYRDSWSEEKVVEAGRTISSRGVRAISLADTVGAAEPERIQRVVASVLRGCPECEVGIHLHSTRAGAGAKVLAAFEAGVDDILTVPFVPEELLARVLALVRRANAEAATFTPVIKVA